MSTETLTEPEKVLAVILARTRCAEIHAQTNNGRCAACISWAKRVGVPRHRSEFARALACTWNPNPEFAAEQIDRIWVGDPEAAHSNADDILLANVDPKIAAAYGRLIDRCRWWACA